MVKDVVKQIRQDKDWLVNYVKGKKWYKKTLRWIIIRCIEKRFMNKDMAGPKREGKNLRSQK